MAVRRARARRRADRRLRRGLPARQVRRRPRARLRPDEALRRRARRAARRRPGSGCSTSMATSPATERPAAHPMRPAPWRVSHVHRETEDTWTLELVPYGDTPTTLYAPGQFTMLYAFGAGEVADLRSAETAPRRLVHTVRAVGPATQAICAAAARATVIGVRGPFGTAWPLGGRRGRRRRHRRGRDRPRAAAAGDPARALQPRALRARHDPATARRSPADAAVSGRARALARALRRRRAT